MGLAVVVFSGAFMAALAALLVYFIPRNWDKVLWKTCIILSVLCMYLMWAITYLAQLHPLVAPQRADLKPRGGHNGEL
ncbi:hypothetical protein GQ42DRAFT_3712 [Ramicandelaber brevisporus]|nr:hypothetical protein GQ42DRAFT_3712 [Ramicandelaber brevisporus]